MNSIRNWLPETGCSGNAYSSPPDQIMRAQKRNTKKRNAYTSMEIQKKVSFVDSRRAKYRHEVTPLEI
ncbi:hypothetical protein OROMI_005057 [Orobanche minor]